MEGGGRGRVVRARERVLCRGSTVERTMSVFAFQACTFRSKSWPTATVWR